MLNWFHIHQNWSCRELEVHKNVELSPIWRPHIWRAVLLPYLWQGNHSILAESSPHNKTKKRHSETRRVYHVVRCQDSNRVSYSCPTCGNVIAIESSEHKKNKKTSKWKKASLRSQDGGFTPQLDNTRQIFEDSKSWLWFSNASSVKRRTCATGLTKCVGLGGRYRRGRLMYYSSSPQLTCVLPASFCIM